MEPRGFWVLSSVSDAQLRHALTELLANGSRTEARIIAHLAEVEERRLHLRDGSDSLYAYCIHVLHLSNSEAFHRITVARIARRFPIVFALLKARALHLTAICLLRDYLTVDNHRELLNDASHKTKTQIEELSARRFPRPDVQSRIRKLPAARATRALAPPTHASPSTNAETKPEPLAEPIASAARATEPTGWAAGSRLATPSPDVPPFQSVVLAAGGTATVKDEERTTTRLKMPPEPRSIEPLSEARYRIQLNASAALKQKLDRLRELTSHANPTGDIALAIERAVDLAIEQAERRRFAKATRPRRVDSPRQSGSSEGRSEAAPISASTTCRKLRLRRRTHIANAVVREVVARDQECCTYVGADGCRCTARAFLQVHHDRSWARGGGDTVDNLRLLCGPHNRLLAEQEFGARYVAQRVQTRRIDTEARKRSAEGEQP